MTRHALLLILALPLLTVVALSVWSPHVARAATAADYKVELQYSADQLMRIKCDGDTVDLTVRITRLSDGSPVAGATVYIRTAIAEQTQQALTNKRGVAHLAVTASQQFPVTATVDGVGLFWGVLRASCPFSGAYGLTIHAFVDKDSSGEQDRPEPNFARGNLILFLRGFNLASTRASREYTLDRTGTFSTTLPNGGFGAIPDIAPPRQYNWTVCLSDSEVAHGWQIVSFNGTAPPPYSSECLTLPVLAEGANNFTVGVARVHTKSPEVKLHSRR